MKSSTCVDHDAWRLANDNKVIVLFNDFDGQIQDGRLHPERGVHNLISVFNFIVSWDLFIVNLDSSFIDGVFIILRGVGFELFDHSLKQGFFEPSLLGKGTIGVVVGFNKSKRVDLSVLWFHIGFVLLGKGLFLFHGEFLLIIKVIIGYKNIDEVILSSLEESPQADNKRIGLAEGDSYWLPKILGRTWELSKEESDA